MILKIVTKKHNWITVSKKSLLYYHFTDDFSGYQFLYLFHVIIFRVIFISISDYSVAILV